MPLLLQRSKCCCALFVGCIYLNITSVSGFESWTFLQEGTASLISQAEELKCFTRMLDDLTCFWDDSMETNSTYNFFYSTDQRSQKPCHTTSYMVLRNIMRHVCVIPTEDILLFQPFDIELSESFSNVSKIRQLVSIDSVVLLDPPSNLAVYLNGNPHQLQISWIPPRNPDINEFLLYEISYWKDKSGSSTEKRETVNAKQQHDLQGLKAGIRYMVRLRTKPDGISFDGYWSAWSETVSAVTPYSSDEIHLRCSTSDLQYITCQWKVNNTVPGALYTLYYQTRKVEWKKCSNQRNATTSDAITYRCTIATSEVNKTVIIINASYPDHTQTFYKKPFRTENVVRPDPPRIVKIDINTTGGKLRLFWEPPIRKFLGQMIYQIRYSGENGTDWKTLLIQKPLHSEVLDLPHSKTYYMQLRAKPNGVTYRGYWSSWSDTFTATIPGSMNPTAVSLVVGVTLLLVIALFVSHLIFPNVYSDVKNKLWPQIPNMERLLEGYLTDFQKYSQPLQPACDKVVDDEILPPVLEIISEINESENIKCVEMHEDVCQKHHFSESSNINQHRGMPNHETENSNTPSQNYIILDLQDTSSLPGENGNCHKRDGSSSLQNSQPQMCPLISDTKNHKGVIQNDINGNKQFSSVQLVNINSMKQQYPTSLDSYDDMFHLFGCLNFPTTFDYRSMSATDISNHSYLLLPDLDPHIFSQQLSLAKE
ncbi:thrombopoietin receptor-like [Stegostoma tigrinum]|uniref:thrombopoietin receptor-like n=1 Tax=Stegostoma tigrinum TaxID=3053191 RepID=UPI0028700132|nr:thrombopoietin receptor-like [Stegostoma tigrinum]